MTMLWCAIIAYILMLNLPYAYAILKQGCAQLTLNIYLVDKLLLLNVTLIYMHKNEMNYIMSFYVYFCSRLSALCLIQHQLEEDQI